jgi:hypothetical protein
MARPLQTAQTATQAAFSVTVGPEDSAPAGARGRRRVAVFIAHGMGQQIPFQTLDQVAAGLRKVDGAPGSRAVGRSLRSDKEGRLERLELALHPGGETVETHIYEAYWAPLTEGKVSLRDVIRFLSGAGRNGLKNARRGAFARWLFGGFRSYPVAIRTICHLLVALATIASLVVMNSTIAAVAAARSLLAQRPAWLTDGLLADLTTTFNVVITAMAAFALSLVVAVLLRNIGSAATRMRAPAKGGRHGRGARTVWTWVTVVLFAATLATVILAGAAIPTLLYAHVRGGVAVTAQLWHALFQPAAVDAFNRAFDTWAWTAAVVGAGAFVAWWAFNIVLGLIRDLTTSEARLRTILNVAAVAGIAGAAVWLVSSLAAATEGLDAGTRTGLAWVLLIGASAFIRRLLVQYVGDVAAYVMPYRLDSFAAIRTEIKARVYGCARAIYAMKRADGSGREYDDVIVVGHSLGSVIAYDAINQLVLEDEGAAEPLDVTDRTALFLTFGSPLDKTAFIFALQGSGTSEAREAVAASVQPMIQSYDHRPRKWINIYSPWDIISGSLDLYDLAGSSDDRRVGNERDPDATTLLIAHTEYWKTDLVFRRIYEALADVAVPARGGPLPTARGGVGIAGGDPTRSRGMVEPA